MSHSALWPFIQSLFGGALITSFVFVFLAELGDKTLYTIVVLATRNHAIPVMLGGWAAFLVQGLIAVALGTLLSRLPSSAVKWGSAAVFMGCGIWLLLKKEAANSDAVNSLAQQRPKLQQFWTTFGMVCVAEFGDATQIGSAALVARFQAPVQVFIGATLGLWTGTVLAVVVGRTIGGRLPTQWLRRGAGVVFCALGLFTALKRDAPVTARVSAVDSSVSPAYSRAPHRHAARERFRLEG